MAETNPLPPQPNTLGKSSLILGIFAVTFVFSVGLCAGVGKEQGWLAAVSGLLFIVGGTCAFAGLIAALLGFAGLFGRNRSRATALIGLILGLITVLLFAAIVNSVQ